MKMPAKKSGAYMEYTFHRNAEKQSVAWTDTESELQPQIETARSRPGGPKPTQPEAPWTAPECEKAMAASVPGSEYWLP